MKNAPSPLSGTLSHSGTIFNICVESQLFICQV